MRILSTLLGLSCCVALTSCTSTRRADETASSTAKPRIVLEGEGAAAGAKAAAQRLRFDFADVGAGNCVAVTCPNSNESLLLDCGTIEGVHDTPPKLNVIRQRQQRALDRIRPLLEGRDVRVVVSHPHSDHMIFLPAVLNGIDVKGVWLGGRRDEYELDAPLPAEFDIKPWLDAREAAGVAIRTYQQLGYDSDFKQEPGLTCGAAKVNVLTVNIGDSKNSRSLVVRLEYENFSAIFPGDAEGSTENRILKRFGSRLKDTSLLAVAHHGARSESSNQETWARALTPQMVLYSAGTLNGHPTCTAVDRYRKVGSLLATPKHDFQCRERKAVKHSDAMIAEYVTELSGAVTVRTDGSTVSVSCTNGCSGE